MKMKENFPFYSAQTTTSRGLIMDALLRDIPPLYLGFSYNVKNAIMGYGTIEFSELSTLILS